MHVHEHASPANVRTWRMPVEHHTQRVRVSSHYTPCMAISVNFISDTCGCLPSYATFQISVWLPGNARHAQLYLLKIIPFACAHAYAWWGWRAPLISFPSYFGACRAFHLSVGFTFIYVHATPLELHSHTRQIATRAAYKCHCIFINARRSLKKKAQHNSQSVSNITCWYIIFCSTHSPTLTHSLYYIFAHANLPEILGTTTNWRWRWRGKWAVI